MKRILITGANSYIGTSFEEYMGRWQDEYEIDTVDMIDRTWRDRDFSGYDVVFHVAGIAHADVGRASEDKKKEYYEVNTELTIETATKAKNEGVRQFIFMSSAIVYGDSAPMGKVKIITKDTKPKPSNFYGDSKLQAEKGIQKLEDDRFKVVILRPPMIYGKGSKGNYPTLAKLARKMPIFPNISNKRSMLYVGNLVELIRMIIDKETRGIYYPQNKEYVSTATMVKVIASMYGKNIRVTRVLNPFVWLAGKVPGKVSGLTNKAFGNFAYDMRMSNYDDMDYRKYEFNETIEKTEK